jgi:hypothetical protein
LYEPLRPVRRHSFHEVSPSHLEYVIDEVFE